LLAFFCLYSDCAFCWTAQVVYVQDGDSLIVKRNNGQKEIIRLYGIDCPEYKQPWGEEARSLAVALARKGSRIEVKPVGNRDAYNRIVAIVLTEKGKVLQEELLRAGLAWFYARYCRTEECSRWADLEQEARKGQGLWQDSTALPPWLWKRINHKP
jgi:endonuclease YncB( thermonuclease family)